MVMLSSNALLQLNQTTSSSFVCDLKKWFQIMKAYEDVSNHIIFIPEENTNRCLIFRVVMLIMQQCQQIQFLNS